MFPILFRLGSVSVYAYGFFLALGFVVGLTLAVLKTQIEGVPFEHVANLFSYTVLSAILGSRLLFIGDFFGHPLPFHVILFKKKIMEIEDGHSRDP
jgi:prolipoprotein diacylglyceryltransferase